MAVTSRNLHPVTQPRMPAQAVWQRHQKINFGILRAWWKPAATILVAYLALLFVTGQATTWLNDLRYGRPRTMQISGMVGHNEAQGELSHFIALNLNRQVVVMELPGGDAAKAQVLQGPYLFGADEALTPVRLRLADLNNDAKDDLVISVKNEEIIYINSGDAFRLINDAERQQLGAVR